MEIGGSRNPYTIAIQVCCVSGHSKIGNDLDEAVFKRASWRGETGGGRRAAGRHPTKNSEVLAKHSTPIKGYSQLIFQIKMAIKELKQIDS